MRKAASAVGQPGAAPEPVGMAKRWKELHAQADDLAKLAQLSPEPFAGAIADFPNRINEAPAPLRALAAQGIEDIETMIRPGLAALATLRERGAAAKVPALALWHEFYTARAAVLSLAHH